MFATPCVQRFCAGFHALPAQAPGHPGDEVVFAGLFLQAGDCSNRGELFVQPVALT
jgi:hypothetical protein